MAKITDLRMLLVDELRDIYHAEKQITRALPKMIKAATSERLKAGFEQHLGETQAQIERLEQCFELLDERVRGKTCEAMRGIIEECQTMLEEDLTPEVCDAVLVASAQKVEHYEIASYGTVIAWAKDLGLANVAKLLDETLEEEKATDVKLTQLATKEINRLAAKAVAA